MKVVNLSSRHPIPWWRQFPTEKKVWENFRFIFNEDEEPYDYLVVFDDPHSTIKPKCALSNIFHVSTEPRWTSKYDNGYLQQYARLIGCPSKETHAGSISTPPYINWHVGWSPSQTESGMTLDFDQITRLFDRPKKKQLSVICSALAGDPYHAQRLTFVKKLKEHYGDKIDWFGRGIVDMDDKLEALQDYRFHIALENSYFPYYFTEKITDCFLTGSFPIYYGCDELTEFFPEKSFVSIDIADFEGAVKVIDRTIANDLDKANKEYMRQSQQLVLYKQQLFPAIAKIINEIENGVYGTHHETRLHAGKILPYRSKKFQRLRVKKRFTAKISFAFENALHRLFE